MRTLIVLLIILSFLQTTILAVDLVIVILILRSYIRSDVTNLYLAFSFGLLISHLSALPLGVISIIYLILVTLARSFSNSRFSENFFVFLPVTALLLSFNNLSQALIINQSRSFYPDVIIETLLSIPAYYLIKVWDERLGFTKGVKLKLGK